MPYRRFGTNIPVPSSGVRLFTVEVGSDRQCRNVRKQSPLHTRCVTGQKRTVPGFVFEFYFIFFGMQLSRCDLEATRDGGRCALCALVWSVLCWVHDGETVPCRGLTLTGRDRHTSEWQAAATNSAYCIQRRFGIQQFYVRPTLYLCVLCGSENKQRLFPYTALTDWFL